MDQLAHGSQDRLAAHQQLVVPCRHNHCFSQWHPLTWIGVVNGKAHSTHCQLWKRKPKFWSDFFYFKYSIAKCPYPLNLQTLLKQMLLPFRLCESNGY